MFNFGTVLIKIDDIRVNNVTGFVSSRHNFLTMLSFMLCVFAIIVPNS